MTRSPFQRRVSAVSLIAVLALSGSALTACGNSDVANASTRVVATTASTHNHTAQAGLLAAMRTLWVQHMEWTRATVTSFATGSPSLQADMNRLLRNQKDIGDAIAPYYGHAAATQLTHLLKVHIEEAVPVLSAAKAGDQPALDKALKDWYANAQDIADFLASANPDNWPQATMRDLMKGHIDMTVGYAGDIISGKAVVGIKKYDEAEAHMIHLGDVLTEGLIAQFPDKF